MTKKLLAILLVPLALAGCASWRGEARPEPVCPRVAILRDLAQLTDYGRAETHRPVDLVARAAVVAVRHDCERAEGGIKLRLDLDLQAARGPAMGSSGEATYPYLVNIVDAQDHVVNQQRFDVRFRLTQDEPTKTQTEKLAVRIPGAEDQAGSLRVLIGFALTPEQLALSRGESIPAPTPQAVPTMGVEKAP